MFHMHPVTDYNAITHHFLGAMIAEARANTKSAAPCGRALDPVAGPTSVLVKYRGVAADAVNIDAGECADMPPVRRDVFRSIQAYTRQMSGKGADQDAGCVHASTAHWHRPNTALRAPR